ncbi:hypothetical protein MSG28_007592 [Choristoneura fumiferana]|uniref:Uncharacterized protein n=1 Tax=Choristoneura fumiferana TaxID=7141 RepID=A0ACC0JY09_CHOFU|nr:hypothetical protein MSG28_007592 [Choristoneura fumiferana]
MANEQVGLLMAPWVYPYLRTGGIPLPTVLKIQRRRKITEHLEVLQPKWQNRNPYSFAMSVCLSVCLSVRGYAQFGIFMNPIWSKTGDFPKRLKDRVAKRSQEQGYSKSRLPSFSQDEIKLIKGSADFLGLNHYTTFLLSPSTKNHRSPSFADDVSVDMTTGEKWAQSRSLWLKSAPYGLYKVCLYINKHYDYPPIIITENGWSSDPGLEDSSRSDYIQQYLKALLLAIEDGTDVLGYTYWSLLDNVEWMGGTE